MLYRTVRAAVNILLWLLFSRRIEGADNIPDNGAVVLCANHLSWWDPLIVACLTRRTVYFMGKKELFDFAPLGAFLRGLGVFPVRRGALDRAAVKRSLELLAQGQVLGIFPEGTRSKTGEMGEVLGGAVYLAARARAVIVPVGISGGYRLFRPLYIRIGAAFAVSGERRLSAPELNRLSLTLKERMERLARASSWSTA